MLVLKLLHPENHKPTNSPFHDFAKRKNGVRENPVPALVISTLTLHVFLLRFTLVLRC